MTRKNILVLLVFSCFVSPLLAAPTMSVIPQGVQAGNWVWQVDITPDLALAGGSTPLAIKIGFRLTGDDLVSVANISPLIVDTNLAGNPIFGWETPYAAPPLPEGIEANCTTCSVTNLAIFGGHAATVVPGTTNEIFAAMGTVDIATPGPVPFLKIVAKGPGTGGPLSSTIDWLGSFGGSGNIAQLVGSNAVNFAIAPGSSTQAVPEPASVALAIVAAGAFAMIRRQSVRV